MIILRMWKYFVDLINYLLFVVFMLFTKQVRYLFQINKHIYCSLSQIFSYIYFFEEFD